jgi:hypothetical protein
MTTLSPVSINLLVKPCNSGMCPALYNDEQGRVYVQGTRLTENSQVAVADHEAIVEITPELIQFIRSNTL